MLPVYTTCQMIGCSKPVGHAQKYCCREHSPLGHLMVDRRPNHTIKGRELERALAQVKICHADGMALTHAAREIGLSNSSVRKFARQLGLKFANRTGKFSKKPKRPEK